MKYFEEEPLCSICHTRVADFEGVICWECKKARDEADLEEERKFFEGKELEQ